MKKGIVILSIVLAIGIGLYIAVFYYKNLRGIKPAITNPPYPISDTANQGGGIEALHLSSDFKIEVFAEQLSGARVLAFDRYGNLWVSRTKEGVISVVVIRDGKAIKTVDVLQGLDKPHGLLFDRNNPNILYIAEEKKVSSLDVVWASGTTEPTVLSSANLVPLVTLTTDSGIHYSRTLAYSPKGEILVSIGSSCNVCYEQSSLRASIQKLEKDGNNWKLTPYATGLRNSVFMTVNPENHTLWATEMGRDLLGDNLPPDELNMIEEGRKYGWPECFGNQVHDAEFDKKVYIVDPCRDTVASRYDFPAHVAPLGLVFVPQESFWGEDYVGNLLVAYHGSWNRSVPIGYLIERIIFDSNGQIAGEEPFIEGWLQKDNKALGRPVDLVFMDGALYISDDHGGVIYRVIRDVSSSSHSSTTPDLITVDGISPIQNTYDATKPSVQFTGSARGNMFFEASFPIVVTDDTGIIVAEGVAEAQSDWMTEEFVPFIATVHKIDTPVAATGKISFRKDNPSGLPEHEYNYIVPVTFKK